MDSAQTPIPDPNLIPFSPSVPSPGPAAPLTHLPFILFVQSKAYTPLEEVHKNCEALINARPSEQMTIYLSAPHSYIKPLEKKFGTHGIRVGAEEMLAVDDNTFTASIAGPILTNENAQFVLMGTAQERKFCQLKEHSLADKCKAALKEKIPPFVCIGETWQEHEEGQSKQILGQQLKALIEGIPSEELKGLHIVYNAVWINDSLWKVTDEILKNTYMVFREAVNETIDPVIRDTLHLIPAVPTRNQKLSEIASIMQSPPYLFAGISLGNITNVKRAQEVPESV